MVTRRHVRHARPAQVSSLLAASCQLGLLALLAVAACAPLPGEAVPIGPPARVEPPPPQVTSPRDAYPLIAGARDLDGQAIGGADRATIVVVFASWCGHCRVELDILAELLTQRDDARVVGVNFRHHEEYDGRGDSAAVRAFVAERAPFMRVIPAGPELFAALGRPPRVPTLYVYDAAGALVAAYDPQERPAPGHGELRALLDGLRGY